MKKSTYIAILTFILIGCNNNKKEEKAALDKIITMHDRVMDNDGELMKNKMRLDTLIKVKSIADIDSAKMIEVQLNNAEAKMDAWMHDFDPDHKEKSHKETMEYLEGEQKKINKIDSLLTSVIKQSGIFLKKAKTK